MTNDVARALRMFAAIGVAVVVVLLLARAANAGSFGLDSDSTGNSGARSFSDWKWLSNPGATTAGLTYTASGGETIDSIRAYVIPNLPTGDSFWVCIYEVEADTLNARVTIDTFVTSGGGAQWIKSGSGASTDHCNGYTLSAGVTYCLLMAAIDESDGAIYYQTGGTGDGEYYDALSSTMPTNPYGNEANKWTQKYTMAAFYSEAAAAATPKRKRKN